MSQRYKLTFEFVLRNPSDYKHIRSRFNEALQSVVDSSMNIVADYFTIEKVEADDDNHR